MESPQIGQVARVILLHLRLRSGSVFSSADNLSSQEVLENYTPRASIVPAALDFRECPFLWPFCRQPIYAQAMPLMFNATVLNGMGLTGEEASSWRSIRVPCTATAMPSAAALHPPGPILCHAAAGSFEAEPLFTPTDDGGKFLDVRFEHSDQLWPWSGFLALYIYVRPEGSAFNGTAAGEVSFTVVSPPMPGEAEDRKSLVKMPLTLAVIPTPPRCAGTPPPTPACCAATSRPWRTSLRVHSSSWLHPPLLCQHQQRC